MCGRFTLSSPAQVVAELFELDDPPPITPRYNIAPTQPVAVVLREPKLAGTAWRMMRWGLVPSWADDPAIGSRMINARAETVAVKPAFRSAFRDRRCLIAADGFYEWQKRAGRKQPFCIRLKEGGPFAFAGLWERWQGADDEPINSCTIITTEANDMLARLHDRMPVILSPDSFARWLNPDEQNRDALQGLLVPFPADRLTAYPVSTRVNSPSNDSPECIEPANGGKFNEEL